MTGPGTHRPTRGRPVTPYLRVDTDRLETNLARVAAAADRAGVALRPHAKTHGCPTIAARQLARGAVGLTVATVGEAEVFAAHGADDLLVAYPLWVDEDRAARLRPLAERSAVTIAADSPEAAAQAARVLAGSGVRLLVEVDSGHHRTGCAPDRAGEVARAATGLEVVGAMTYPGHAYSPGAVAAAAAAERDALRGAAASLRAVGVEPTVLSGGSTPSLAAALTDPSAGAATELRPGVYPFFDAQQWELGSCSPEDVALTCVATVVSHAGGRAVLDAGSKALGADRPAWTTGWGRLLDHPDARVVQLSEHHAVVDLAGAPLPRLGSRVRVVPNHVCNAVALADVLHAGPADVDERDLDRWAVAARGRNG